ncbi:MAG: tetratricopeptide repeat protein, partial [Candidatus Eisenbacteria bacterium]|nr:tetratricopeptide repeat protein [Candidatus Eisenbacteria bacterium]
SRRKLMWVGVGALAVALALLVGAFRDRFAGLSQGGAEAPRIASIAVLPLGNFSGDPEQEYFSDGLTENLIANLAKISALKVTSRTSVMRYKQTEKPLREIAGELGVDAIIEGSAQRSGDRVRITAQLIDAKTDQHLWADTYDRPVADVLALQSEVAREIARQIRVTVTPEQENRLTSARKVNPAVYDAYLRGMFYVSQNTPESFEKGMKLLHEAVAIDPAEPLAYAGLAEGYVTLGHGGAEQPDAYPRARAAAEQALKLDPNLAEAVGALADVALYYDWDWQKAENLFKRALDLNPSLAMTHYHYAWYLALFDRLDEAIAEHKLARDLDPLRPLHTAWLGGLYLQAGRPDEAVAEVQKSIELNPAFWPSYFVLCRAYLRMGMSEDAIVAAQRLIELEPVRGNVFLGVAYAQTGRTAQARAIAAMLEGAPARSFQVAMLHAALGDKDAAFRVLEAAYAVHPTALPWIRVHGLHDYDPLREDPRFQDLLRRMKLPG